VINSLLDFLCIFDWISPLLAWFQDRLRGPSHTFLIPEGCGWSGREIQQMLNGHGIRVWGLMFLRHTLLLTVRETQARWAQYLLQRQGIPILNEVQAWKRAPHRKVGQNPPSSSPADNIQGWLDKLTQGLGL
jgi:hypothetical protein